MRIVLSIAGSSGHAEAARWALTELIAPLGCSVGERPEGGAPFLLLAHGQEPAERSRGFPRVIIPRQAADLAEGAFPEAPVEALDAEGNARLAFPPFGDLPPGEPLWRDPRGRPVACRPTGAPEEVRLAFDLVSAAHFFLSRREERDAPRDTLDRFRPESGWAARHGLLGEPVVDRLGRTLLSAIEAALLGSGAATVRVLPWPAGESFAVALTHDEDLVIRWERRLARHAAQALLGRGGSRGTGLRFLLRDVREGKVSPVRLSERLAEWESEKGIRSTFFFLSVREDRFARRYDVGSLPIRRFVRSLIDDGHAVGLHGGIEGYLSRESFLEEGRIVSEAAGHPVAGVRQHYARLRAPETWIAQRDAGLRYDASLGFPDAPGFRAGTSFPFRPETVGDFLAIPLHGMDRALVESGLSRAEEWDRWALPASRVGGLVDILWHPYFIDPDLGSDREPLARTLLAWIEARSSEAWVPTLDELADWWSGRRLVTVEGMRREERSFVRIRFGAPLGSVCLEAVPRGADIRIEAATGAHAEIVAHDSGRVVVTGIRGGAEVVLSLHPCPAGRRT